MKLLLKIILVIAVIVVLVGGYLGFIPGVSGLFGSDQPRDLGATYTEADLASGQAKLNQQLVDLNGRAAREVLTAALPVASDARLTGKEFAAHLEAVHPISNVQLIFNSDNTFEASGRIDKERISAYAQLLGLTGDTEAQVMDAVNKYLPGSPVFYIKGTGKIINNEPTLSWTQAEVGRLPVPTDRAAEALVAYAKLAEERVPGLKIDNFSIQDGQLVFKGTLPREFPKW